MPRALPITGEYPPDWPEIAARVRAEAGHRCIRCGHPYRTGTHGNGEWSPCDAKCRHAGPLAILWPDGSMIEDITNATVQERLNLDSFADGKKIVARWRILTTHHFNGVKSDVHWSNLMALCQKCHLTIQSRVNPEVPYFLEHSAWAKPFIAAFYARKYEGRDITREEAGARMDELLAYERMA